MNLSSHQLLRQQLATLDKEALIDRLFKLENALEYGVEHDEDFDYQVLIHELEVHQVELEMQNRELRESQNALEKATENFSLLYEYAPVGYCTVDLCGVIKQINRTAKNLFGRRRQDFVGTNIKQLLDLKPGFDLNSFLAECYAGRGGQEFEARCINLPSSVKSLQIVSMRKPTYLSQEMEVLVALIDKTPEKIISEHEHFLLYAGDTLAQSVGVGSTIDEALQMAQAVNGGAVMLDIWFKDSTAARFVAEAQQASVAEKTAKTVALLRGADEKHLKTYIARCRSMQQPQVVSGLQLAELLHDTQLLAAMREEKIETLLVVPIYARGLLIGVMSFLGRSTGAKRSVVTPDHLIRYARQAAIYIDNAYLLKHAQDSAKSREQILAVVSHDLRSPLSAIKMRSERLQYGRHASLDPKVQEAGRLIVRYAERMDHLIGDLLDVTSISSGGLSMSRENVAVEVLLSEVEELWAHPAEAAGITLTTSGPSGLDVLADRERLLQALGNIIGNAIKFTPRGGALCVGAKLAAPLVEFTVADTGIGIEPDKIAHIFDRFWQVDAQGQRGIGLGLSIAKGIVETGGGIIWADSQFGQGTTLHFTVPCGGQVDKTALEAPCSVLIVEDDYSAAEMIKEVFEEAGHSVAIVGDGKQALEFLSERSLPQLVLLDLKMPVMDGWQFLARRQQMARLKDLNIVVYSSEADVSDRVSEFDARFLSKNSSLDKLLSIAGHV